MRLRFVFLALVCILAISLYPCPRSINAEILDNDREFISGVIHLPIQIIFDPYVYFFNWFVIVIAFVLLPKQFLIQYISRHENSPPVFL